MAEAGEQQNADLIELSGEIVAAYVGHNALSPTDLRKLIGEVYAALKGLGAGSAASEAEAPKPAVPVRHSTSPDYLTVSRTARSSSR
jgi:predicted transcriptional regulator